MQHARCCSSATGCAATWPSSHGPAQPAAHRRQYRRRRRFLPELLADFLVQHPYTDIALEELPSPAIAQAIAERAADIGIVADHADLRGLASYPSGRIVWCWRCRRGMRSAAAASSALRTPCFDFIGLPEQSALQQHLEQLAIRSGGPMRLRARAAISTPSAAWWCCAARAGGGAGRERPAAVRDPRNALPLTDDWAIRRSVDRGARTGAVATAGAAAGGISAPGGGRYYRCSLNQAI
ncbi:LysR substrate-binding domain-containing protein [Serratia ureilytica]